MGEGRGGVLAERRYRTASMLNIFLHPSGSDKWSAAERRQFNKGMAAYKKDFFMVQKQASPQWQELA